MTEKKRTLDSKENTKAHERHLVVLLRIVSKDFKPSWCLTWTYVALKRISHPNHRTTRTETQSTNQPSRKEIAVLLDQELPV